MNPRVKPGINSYIIYTCRIYSYLSATIGSTLVALRAGM